MLSFCLKMIVILAIAEGYTLKNNLDDHWNEFKIVHGKNYHPHIEQQKRLIFNKNMNKIIDHNIEAELGIHTHRLGINEFSDMAHDEFVRNKNYPRRKRDLSDYLEINKENETSIPTDDSPAENLESSYYQSEFFNLFKINTELLKSDILKLRKKHVLFVPIEELPEEVDWVKYGSVTRVLNQGDFYSCWAFAATGAIEGAWHRKTGHLEALSQQQLIDCSISFDNEQYGGFTDTAIRYVIERKGIDRKKCYHYLGNKFDCHFNKLCVGAQVTDFKYVEEGNELALMEALATVGPIAIDIDASLETLKQYESGIYYDSECDSTNLNHAVLLVGYGTENNQDYWLIKNSWGISWGENGYFRLARNANNMCGVSTNPVYAII